MTYIPPLEPGQIWLDPKRNWTREIIGIATTLPNRIRLVFYKQNLGDGVILYDCSCRDYSFRQWISKEQAKLTRV